MPQATLNPLALAFLVVGGAAFTAAMWNMLARGTRERGRRGR